MGILSTILGTMSGNKEIKVSEQLLFDKVIGFKSIVPGCGASTILQNVAIALSNNTKFNICVLDTNFLFPLQYPLLCNTEATVDKNKELDILDYNGSVNDIVRNTSYSNVYIAQLDKRTVIDMLSGKDTSENIVKLIASLKTFFDIVLIDLSYEMTNTNIYSAIKCNRIYQVADTSLKCLYYLKKSINTSVTLGVPLAKADKVIINKVLDNVDLGIESTFKEAKLEIIGAIPLSQEVAVACASGQKIYGRSSKDKGISEFNKVITNLIGDIMENNTVACEYGDIKQELQKMQEKTKKAEKKEEITLVDEDDGDYEVEEFDTEVFDEEIYDEENSKSSVDLGKKGENIE